MIAQTMGRILLVAIVCSTSCYAYRYIGCFEDKKDRILEGKFTSGEMTIEKCVQICSYAGDYYAGVEVGDQCFCGKHLKQYSKLDDNKCSRNCRGDSSQKCGETWKISVFTTYDYLGCYVDKSTRILEGPSTTSDHMTTEYCINYCGRFGKRFALTQYSKQCFCGDHLRPYEKKPDSECKFKCEGAKSEMCGGFWRGSLYIVH